MAESKRIAFRWITPNRLSEQSYLVSLRNHKDRDVTIRVIRRNYGDWKVLSASHPYTRPSADELRFEMPVPKNREVKLTYTTRTRY